MFIGRLPRFLQSKKAYVSVAQAAVTPGVWPDKVRPLAVTALLSGQGAQSAGMLNALYQAVPEIKAVMDQGETIFQARRGTSLLELMNTGGTPLNQTENTQPAVFLGTAALYDLLKNRGFSPDAVIGHSVGEFSALYCLGLLGFDEAMNLILTRSSLMKEAADQIRRPVAA